MSDLDVQLLRSSFQALKPFATEAIDQFYSTLFQDYPQAESLFDTDQMGKQKKALIASLVYIVDHVDQPDQLKSYLTNLGKRHKNYGVEAFHYDWVAQSLLKTLAYYFDDTWTAELEKTWHGALTTVALFMLEGQQETEASSSKPVPKEEWPPIVEQVHKALGEVFKEVMEDLAKDEDILKLAREKAKTLIQYALERELAELKIRHANKKAA